MDRWFAEGMDQKYNFAPQVDESKIKSLFNQYSDGEKIKDEKFLKFFQDISVDMEDLTSIYVLHKMKVSSLGVIKYDEFKEGSSAFNVGTLAEWKSKMAEVKKSWLKDEKEFKRAYTDAFVFNREDGMNNVETDTCIEMWKLWLNASSFSKCQFVEKWFDFLTNVKKPNVIKKDQWIQFYELCKQTGGDFTKYPDVDDGTWPELIDDFNEYMTQ